MSCHSEERSNYKSSGKYFNPTRSLIGTRKILRCLFLTEINRQAISDDIENKNKKTLSLFIAFTF